MTREANHPSSTMDAEIIKHLDAEPDWSIFEPPNPSVLEIPKEKSILTASIDYGDRFDGSRQIGMLYGTIEHTYSTLHPIYGRTLRDWHMVKQWYEEQGVDIAERAVLITEGRTRFTNNYIIQQPIVDLAVEAKNVINAYSELGLFEYLARQSGIKHVFSAEPEDNLERNFFLEIAREHGFGPTICMLGERLLPQVASMGKHLRVSASHYVWWTMWDRYAPLMHCASMEKEDTGITGFKRYLNSIHPEYSDRSLGDLVHDPGFIQTAHSDTRHIPVLRIPEALRNPIQRVTLATNKKRDRELKRAYATQVAQGKDVFVAASAVHLIPILSATQQSGIFSSIDYFGEPFGLHL